MASARVAVVLALAAALALPCCRRVRTRAATDSSVPPSKIRGSAPEATGSPSAAQPARAAIADPPGRAPSRPPQIYDDPARTVSTGRPPVTGPASKKVERWKPVSGPALRYEVVMATGKQCRISASRPCAWEPGSRRGYSSLLVRHHKLEDGALLLSIPEAMRLAVGPNKFIMLEASIRDQPRWKAASSKLTYTRSWTAKPRGAGGKPMKLRTTWRVSCGRGSSLSIDLTMTNLGPQRLPMAEAIVCLAAQRSDCNEVRMFSRGGGTRRWAHGRSGWIEITGHAEVPVNGAPAAPWRNRHGKGMTVDQGLMAQQHRTGWIAALGWDRASAVQYAALECIHAHPYAAGLAPGEKVTRRGRLYLFRGSMEALLRAHKRALGGR